MQHRQNMANASEYVNAFNGNNRDRIDNRTSGGSMEVRQISTLGDIRDIPWCLLTIEAAWPAHHPKL